AHGDLVVAAPGRGGTGVVHQPAPAVVDHHGVAGIEAVLEQDRFVPGPGEQVVAGRQGHPVGGVVGGATCVEHPVAAIVVDHVRGPHMGLADLGAGVQHRVVHGPFRVREVLRGGVQEHRLVQRVGGFGVPDPEYVPAALAVLDQGAVVDVPGFAGRRGG